LWTVVVARWSAGALPSWWLPVPLALSWFGMLLTHTDLRHRRLPDALTRPAYSVAAALLGCAALARGDPALAVRAALAGALCLLAHAAVHLAVPTALGAGDVKLIGPLGAVLGALGWWAVPAALLLSALITLTLSTRSPAPGSATTGPNPSPADPISPVQPPATPTSAATQASSPTHTGLIWSGPPTAPPRVPRTAPHGPGLLAATWLLATLTAPP
jgi:Flp pilus assembly protein protease CpaA